MFFYIILIFYGRFSLLPGATLLAFKRKLIMQLEIPLFYLSVLVWIN